ncbi:MAG TPA: PIN domain-containing protein [Spirochaetia bacterium]|nr:PIN domain-containing protein [Spirochaetia bacterium]
MKTILFIDYENFQTLTLDTIDPTSTEVWFFVGETQNKLPFSLVESSQRFGASLKWIKIEGTGKNNLDFHIVYELGRISAGESPSPEVYILSKDKGYDAVINYAKRFNMRVRRIVNASQMPSSTVSAPQSKYTESAVANLGKIPTARRPRTRSSLEKHLRSAFQGKIPAEDVATIIEELFVDESITEKNNRIHYKF